MSKRAESVAEVNANSSHGRRLVLVSGYYGFGNLGDEAILEELVTELKRLSAPENIVVLSADPRYTSEQFGVRSVSREDFLQFMSLCKQARLFVSGGGGLFQNTRTLGSIVFYAAQVVLAKALGSKVAIYAQGIGPLRGSLAEWITKQAFLSADAVAVRDSSSKAMLDSWGVPAAQTADPVWCLDSKRLPQEIEDQLAKVSSNIVIGLSLRISNNFNDGHLVALVDSLRVTVPENAHLILLPLQDNQDSDILARFARMWSDAGRHSTLLNVSSLTLPSQWISLFGRCRMLVGMRLHALIMSIKAGIPVVGIAYDPKVTHLMDEFEQPILNLLKDPNVGEWEQTLKTAFNEIERLKQRAMRKAEGAKKLACQNFNVLSKILDPHT